MEKIGRGVRIKVKNDLLSWARSAMGLSVDEAAKKLGIASEYLKEWESESTEISLSYIKKIAHLYKRQVSFFFLPNAPTEKPIPTDFRTLDSVRQEEVPQKVRLAIRRAQANRRIIKDFFPQDYKDRIDEEISFSQNPTRLGETFRGKFNISLEDQFGLRDEKVALAFWIGIFEEKGIPIFQMELEKDFRGFCLRENNLPPVIVLNSKDVRSARIFTLLHEFSHLLIKQRDIDSVVAEQGIESAHKYIESFANEFAGSFLVPNRHLQEEPQYQQYKQTKDDEIVSRLSKKFSVSQSVILRRFYSLGVITKSEYEIKERALRMQYEKIKLLEKLKREANPNSFPRRNVPKEVLQKVGIGLGAKAFQSVSEGRMSTFDLIQFLDVKVKHLGVIRGLVDKSHISVV